MKKIILTENQIKRLVDNIILKELVMRKSGKILNSQLMNKKYFKNK
jgi:hypothetical protein